jgi:TRAP-type transport system periplasmic protein
MRRRSSRGWLRWQLLALVGAIAVTACGGDAGGDTTEPTPGVETTTSEPTDTMATTTEAETPSTDTTVTETTGSPDLEPVTLDAVTAWPMNQTSHTGPFTVFMEAVEELSGGAITVEIIGGPETMDVFDVAENLSTGSMDLALTSTGYYSEAIPESLVFEATLKSPAEWREEGLFDAANEWHIERLNQSVIGRLGWGQAYGLYSAVPIETVDDFQGLRFRGSALYVGFLEELGVEAINIAPGEIYTSLERSAVDGTAWTDIGGTQLALHEVIDQVIMPPYYNSGIVLNINQDTWESLSAEAQDVITQAAIQAEEASPDLMAQERDAEVEIYESAGVEILTFEGEEAERYLNASREGIRTEFERRGFDDAMIDELLAQYE